MRRPPNRSLRSKPTPSTSSLVRNPVFHGLPARRPSKRPQGPHHPLKHMEAGVRSHRTSRRHSRRTMPKDRPRPGCSRAGPCHLRPLAPLLPGQSPLRTAHTRAARSKVRRSPEQRRTAPWPCPSRPGARARRRSPSRCRTATRASSRSQLTSVSRVCACAWGRNRGSQALLAVRYDLLGRSKCSMAEFRSRCGVVLSPLFRFQAYGSSRIAAGKVQQILNWPGSFETFRKIPTCLLYDQTGQVMAWGIEAKNAGPMPGAIKCEWYVHARFELRRILITGGPKVQALLGTARAPGPSERRSSPPCIAGKCHAFAAHAGLAVLILLAVQPGKQAIDLIIDFLSCLWDYAKQQITREIGAVADLGTRPSCFEPMLPQTDLCASVCDRFGRCMAHCARCLGCNWVSNDARCRYCRRSRPIREGWRPRLEGTPAHYQVSGVGRPSRAPRQRPSSLTANQKPRRCIVRTSRTSTN